jgi:hypothetical protein
MRGCDLAGTGAGTLVNWSLALCCVAERMEYIECANRQHACPLCVLVLLLGVTIAVFRSFSANIFWCQRDSNGRRNWQDCPLGICECTIWIKSCGVGDELRELSGFVPVF